MEPPASPDPAAVLARAGRWREALALLDAVPPASPGYAAARVRGAFLLRGLAQLEPARARLAGAPQTAAWCRLAAAFATDDGAHAAAEAWLERAAAIAEGEGDRVEVARARLAAAELASYRGALLRAEEEFGRVLAEAPTLPDPELRIDALCGLGSALRYAGRFAEAAALLDEAEAAARAVGYRQGLHVALRSRAGLALALGRAAEAAAACTAAHALAVELEHPDGLTWCETGLGEAARLEGDLDRAEQHYRRALQQRVIGVRRLAIVLNLGLVEARRGRHAAARALLEGELEGVGKAAGPGWRALLHGTLLEPLEALGDEAGWHHHYARTVALLAETGEVEVDLAESLTHAAELAEARGALGRAARAWALARAQWAGVGRAAAEAQATAALGRLTLRAAPIPVGPFDLAGPVGEGAMGTVWRGEHHALGHPVAVKVLLTATARTADAQAAFRAEARAVAALDHPAIVPVHDHGVVDAAAERMSGGRLVADSPFLVMAFAEGGTLESRLGCLEWSACRVVLENLLGALGHAHARGVVHRDIKPANVLVRGDGRIWLSDFGLSHAVGLVAGTPRSMAPEQFIRGADHGAPADLYAVGCLATVLVSGRWPFEVSDLAALRRAHLFEAPPPLRPVVAVPERLERWILRLLAKDPSARFANAAAAAAALADLGPLRRPAAWDRPIEAPAGAAGATLAPDPSGATASLADRRTLLPLATVLGPAPESEPEAPPPRAPDPEEPLPLELVDSPVPEAPPPEPAGHGWLAGTGLGLLGLRRPPLVGREAERAALWRALLDVRRAGRPKVIDLVGAPGVGRTRLLEWIGEHAAECGAAERVAVGGRVVRPSLLLLDDGASERGALDGPLLVVRVGAGGGEPLAVPPLGEAELSRLAREGLGLAPALAEPLVAAAAGRPQWLVQRVRAELARGRLVVGEGAFTLRGGVAPPTDPSLDAAWDARLAPMLEGPAGPALAVAAALPPPVGDADWQRAAAAAGVELPPGLVERLLDEGLALRAPGGWRFAHPSAHAAVRRAAAR